MIYEVLIEKLINKGSLRTPILIQAFKKIKRADFLPQDLKKDAGLDAPLPIGFGQTNSQPFTVAFMLELLKPETGDKILDIGSGSGWTSALLAQCVGEQGRVFAIERIPELYEFGKKNIAKYGFLDESRVKVRCADGSLGWTEAAPFDKIIAAASARIVPEAWRKQLKIGGRLVLPVKESIWLFVKKNEDKFEKKEFPGFAFVPLIKENA